MIIQTAHVRQRARRYKGTVPYAILGLEGEPFFRGASAIHYDLMAQRLQNELLLRGSLMLELDCLCSRCAEWFRRKLRLASFLHAYSITSENQSIDLTADIREDILLALPMNLVCSPECRGRCPGCGVDLNQQPCACRPSQAAPAWNALDRLHLNGALTPRRRRASNRNKETRNGSPEKKIF